MREEDRPICHQDLRHAALVHAKSANHEQKKKTLSIVQNWSFYDETNLFCDSVFHLIHESSLLLNQGRVGGSGKLDDLSL